jgi:uncharacterized membrane protein YdjX (TVP38/TMEM64 family)
MQILITNLLLLLLTGGVGYLVGQARPDWFGPQLRDRLMFAGWIIALLLAGALRAAALVYGPEAMFAVLSVAGGFVFGVWFALRSSGPGQPRRRR